MQSRLLVYLFLLTGLPLVTAQTSVGDFITPQFADWQSDRLNDPGLITLTYEFSPQISEAFWVYSLRLDVTYDFAQPLYISFAGTAGNWSEWQRIQPDAHQPEGQDFVVTKLGFTDARHRFFRLKYTGNPTTSPRVQIRFYDPGTTTPTVGHFGTAAADERGQCECEQPDFEDRQDWCPAGTCPEISNPNETLPTHLIVHHSAGVNTASDWSAVVRAIWDFHVNTNGWDDVGYNWLIDPNGVLYEGRGDNVSGAHFCGMNSKTVGICMLGDFTNITPTDEAKATLTRLLAWKSCDRAIDPLEVGVHPPSGQVYPYVAGHRDGCATACPGDSFYPQLPSVREAVADYREQNCNALAGATQLSAVLESTDQVRLGWMDIYDNESGFRVERAVNDANDFQFLTVNLADNNSYVDEDIQSGNTYYYRVQAFNETSNSAFSNVASVSTVMSSNPDIYFNTNTVELFPSPVADDLSVIVKNNFFGSVHLDILDQTGRRLRGTQQVEKRTPEHQLQLSVSDLASGIYLLRLQYENGIATFRFIK